MTQALNLTLFGRLLDAVYGKPWDKLVSNHEHSIVSADGALPPPDIATNGLEDFASIALRQNVLFDQSLQDRNGDTDNLLNSSSAYGRNEELEVFHHVFSEAST